MTNYTAAVLADSPTGYWRLGESSGASAVDLSPNANTGTYTGGYTLNQASALLEDTVNTGVLLDGTSGYIALSDIAAYAFPSGFTLEAWIKLTSTQVGVIVERRTVANLGGWILYYAGTSLVVFAYIGAWNSATWTGAVNDGLWHHIVGTYDGANLRLYVDGAQVQIAACTGAVNNPAASVPRIGNSAVSPAYLPGAIDEVAIYPTALSANRIATHYLAGQSLYAGTAESDAPSAYWRLGETAGTSAIDSSGNGRTGTYTGTYTLNQAGPLGAVGDSNPGVLLQSGYIQCPMLPCFNGGSWTIELWARSNGAFAAGDSQMFCVGDGSGNDQMVHCVTPSGTSLKLGFWFDDYQPAITLSINTWYHLVFSFDAPTRAQRIYANGVAVGAGRTATGTPTLTTGSRSGGGMQIGRVDGASVANLFMDEFAIYPVALSPARILAHYKASVLAGARWNAAASRFENAGSYPFSYWDATSGTFRLAAPAQALWDTAAPATFKST